MGTPSTQKWLAVTAPVLVGGVLYLLFRPTTLVLFTWIDHVGLQDLVHQARAAAAQVRPPAVFVDSVPAGLWAWSFAATLRAIWPGQPRVRYAFVALVLLIGAGSELLQWCDVIPGTFDPVDLAFYLAGTALGAALPTPKE